MPEVKLTNSKECRNAYRDILQGYSFVSEGNKYIKHFAEADLGFLESIYNTYKTEALDLGLMLEHAKLKFLAEESYWTIEEEEEFQSAKMHVIDTKDHFSKLVIPQQKEDFKKVVKKEEETLANISKERDEVLAPTVESYCNKSINEDYVYNAIYKDKELKEPYYEKEEFDDLTYRDMSLLIKQYNESISFYSEKNIKRIAVNSFFLNAFMMCDNDPVKFFGKPVLKLTIYQMNLFTRGKFCKSVLTEGENPPDEYYLDDIEGVEKLMNWYDNQYNLISSRRQQDQLQSKQAASMKGNRAPRGAKKVRKAGRGGR